MKNIPYCELPWNLQDVVERLRDLQVVYGFELELLASYVS